jgi:hypothetical protein
MSDQPYQPPLTIREDGSYHFQLRDGVGFITKWNSPDRLHVEMYQNLTLLPPDIGNIYSSTFRDRLVSQAEARFWKQNVPHLAEDIGAVAIALGSPGADGKTLHEQLEASAGRTVTERLIIYARKNATFWHDPEREAYSTVKAKDHTENYRVRSRAFRMWVRHTFWKEEKRRLEEEVLANEGGALHEGGEIKVPDPPPVRDQCLTDAVLQLESLALFEGEEHAVHLRIAEHDGNMYIDLCNAEWRVVEVTPEGWKVIAGDEAPVKFIRKGGMLPLPDPVEGGSVERLRGLLNIGDGQDGERNFRLVLAWLTQALTTRGPYSVLTLLGNQGSAKSTTQRILRMLIDPNTSPIRSKPREEHNLYIDATSGWIIALNNMSSIPEWLSDGLASIATGGGFSVRRLYTDEEQILFDAMRPITINGIGDVVTRSDLLDRALIVNLPDIKDQARREERELYAELEAARGEILGGLLTAVVTYLKDGDSVDLSSKPRMVDFARLGVATEVALGGEKGSFLEAYQGSQEDAVETALASHPIVPPLWEFAKSFEEDGPWVGTPTELLKAINDRVDDDDLKRVKDYPKQANVLSAQLNCLAPDLRKVGIYYQRTRAHGGVRQVQVFYKGKL